MAGFLHVVRSRQQLAVRILFVQGATTAVRNLFVQSALFRFDRIKDLPLAHNCTESLSIDKIYV